MLAPVIFVPIFTIEFVLYVGAVVSVGLMFGLAFEKACSVDCFLFF